MGSGAAKRGLADRPCTKCTKASRLAAVVGSCIMNGDFHRALEVVGEIARATGTFDAKGRLVQEADANEEQRTA